MVRPWSAATLLFFVWSAVPAGAPQDAKAPDLVVSPGGGRVLLAFPSAGDGAYDRLTVWDVASRATVPVTTPGTGFRNVIWSPDGSRIAFVAVDSALTLWVADAATGDAKAVTGPVLNGALGAPCAWVNGAPRLLCRFMPQGRGAEPTDSTPESLFAWRATAQLAMVDVATGSVTPIGTPAAFLQSDPAPSGKAILINRVSAWAPGVPVASLAQTLEVWTPNGSLMYKMVDLPLVHLAPGAVRLGPREVQWRPGDEATLFYVEALDGGEDAKPAEYRDHVMAYALPFISPPVELGKLSWRFGGVVFGNHGLALVTETDHASAQTRTWALNSDNPAAIWHLLDAGEAGALVMALDSTGFPMLLQPRDGKILYRIGVGDAEKGGRSLLDRIGLSDWHAKRVWQAEPQSNETVVAVLHPDAEAIVTRKEVPGKGMGYLWRDIKRDSVRVITSVNRE